MRLLFISNMYPSAQKPYAGIFVRNQYERVRELLPPSDRISILYMQRTFTGGLGSLLKYTVTALRFLPLLLRRFDVIHVQFFYPLAGLAYVYKRLHPRTALVVTFHGADIGSHIRGGLNQRIFARIAGAFDHVIAVGQDLKDEIAEKLRIEVHTVLSAGVDERVFYPVECEKRYDFLFVGSFITRKGVDLLCEAIAALDDRSIRYCFVGSGPLLSSIRRLAERYDITIAENQTQPELRGFYNQSRFLVLPARREPFGLVASEAIFCGTPAVVAATGGLREQVREGENGYLITEATAADVAARLAELHEMDEQSYAALSARTAETNREHSLQSVCERLLAIYGTLRP